MIDLMDDFSIQANPYVDRRPTDIAGGVDGVHGPEHLVRSIQRKGQHRVGMNADPFFKRLRTDAQRLAEHVQIHASRQGRFRTERHLLIDARLPIGKPTHRPIHLLDAADARKQRVMQDGRLSRPFLLKQGEA